MKGLAMNHIQYIETHVHLDMMKRRVDQVIDDATKVGVIKMITMGVDLETNRKNLFYSQKYQNVYSAVGIHPHESKKINGKDLDEVDEMLSSSKIMAVGE